MFIDKNSITITGGGKTINMGSYIVQAKYGYNKLWSKDSGRNLAGTQSGTLLGIFPKIILSFKKLTKSQLENITPLLDSARQSVTYYDPTKKRYITIQTYTGDYEVTNKRIINAIQKNEGFDVSFIAIKKR